MRTFKLIGAIVVVLAFSAVAVATASAAETLWKWLPGSVGETFTGKSGKATLNVPGVPGATITCAKSTILLVDASLIKEGSTNEKDATLALAIIHFESCTAFGVTANSLGDDPGIILVHVDIHNCMIQLEPTKIFGVLIKPLEVHIEVPSLKLLVLVKGSVIGLLEGAEGTKQLTFGLNLKVNAAKEQEFLKCEGGGKDELETKVDEKGFLPSTEEAKEGKLTFDMTKDTLGEEMMEN